MSKAGRRVAAIGIPTLALAFGPATMIGNAAAAQADSSHSPLKTLYVITKLSNGKVTLTTVTSPQVTGCVPEQPIFAAPGIPQSIVGEQSPSSCGTSTPAATPSGTQSGQASPASSGSGDYYIDCTTANGGLGSGDWVESYEFTQCITNASFTTMDTLVETTNLAWDNNGNWDDIGGDTHSRNDVLSDDALYEKTSSSSLASVYYKAYGSSTEYYPYPFTITEVQAGCSEYSTTQERCNSLPAYYGYFAA